MSVGPETKTDKVTADKENVLGPMESETDLPMHAYSQVYEHASAH